MELHAAGDSGRAKVDSAPCSLASIPGLRQSFDRKPMRTRWPRRETFYRTLQLGSVGSLTSALSDLFDQTTS
jgi:hypothetical protein